MAASGGISKAGHDLGCKTFQVLKCLAKWHSGVGELDQQIAKVAHFLQLLNPFYDVVWRTDQQSARFEEIPVQLHVVVQLLVRVREYLPATEWIVEYERRHYAGFGFAASLFHRGCDVSGAHYCLIFAEIENPSF